MSGAERIARAADRHGADLAGALADFAARAGIAEDAAARSGPPESDHQVRERLRAAADYADLPPQILLPAQFSHDSPHRRGAV